MVTNNDVNDSTKAVDIVKVEVWTVDNVKLCCVYVLSGGKCHTCAYGNEIMGN